MQWRENPPPWATDHDLWEEAYWTVEPYWDDKDEPWAVVATIYKKKLAAQTPVKRRQKLAERARNRRLIAEADYVLRSVTPTGKMRKGVKRLSDAQLDVLMLFLRARNKPKKRRGAPIKDVPLLQIGASEATLRSLERMGYIKAARYGWSLTLKGQALVFE